MLVTLETPKPHSKQQKIIMNAFNYKNVLEIWVANGTKNGKALSYQEVIPTVDGWKEMGKLKAGDHVFDENGKPTKILSVTDLMYGHKCYEVVFSDGSKIVADEEHLWTVESQKRRKNFARNPDTKFKPETLETRELIKNLKIYKGEKERPNYSIDLVANAVEFNSINLSVDPYVLGVWLGDGTANDGSLTSPDDQIIEEIRSTGLEVNKNKAKYRWGILKLAKVLRENNLKNNKHIPSDYLRGSKEQRLAILQGLMDSDGYVNKRGHAYFYNTNKNIADGFEMLAASLGIKVTRSSKIGKLNGIEHKLCYIASFATDLPVFRLKRKLDRIGKVQKKSRRRYIAEINEVESVPVCCITVENPTHLFLAGKSCIPTHNSIGASVALSQKAWMTKTSLYRWVAPIYSQSKIGLRYCQRMLPTSPHVTLNKSDPSITVNDKDTRIEFWHGQDPESLEGEACNGYVLDECSKMVQQVYDSALTTTTVTRGPILAISTPRGKNWFYEKCMDAKERMEYDIARGNQPTKIFITSPSSLNPKVTPEALAEAKRNLPDRLFRQYFLAEFVDDGDVFGGFRGSIYGYEIDSEDEEREIWFDDGYKFDKYGLLDVDVVIGADWGKRNDYCVFTAWDFKRHRLIAFQRFRGASYIEAIKNLIIFNNRFKKVMIIKHDKTGLGEVIDDLLDKTPLAHDGVVFHNRNKSEMVNSMMVAFEQNNIKIPNWKLMCKELDAFEVTTSDIGTMKYSAPAGMHDDIVSSMILGWLAVTEYSEGQLDLRIVEELASTKNEYADWLNNSYDEPEDFQRGWQDVKGYR